MSESGTTQLLAKIAAAQLSKNAFVPAPPMDPAAGGGMPPGMDPGMAPAAMGMDPAAAMAGAGMPVDPAMAMAGGAAGMPADPAAGAPIDPMTGAPMDPAAAPPAEGGGAPEENKDLEAMKGDISEIKETLAKLTGFMVGQKKPGAEELTGETGLEGGVPPEQKMARAHGRGNAALADAVASLISGWQR